MSDAGLVRKCDISSLLISVNVTELGDVNKRFLFRFGTFYYPLLGLMMLVEMFIMFYVRGVSCLWESLKVKATLTLTFPYP